MPVLINNIFSHGQIIYENGKALENQQFSRSSRFSFYRNTLSLTSSKSFTLSLTKDIEVLLLHYNLQNLVRNFLEEELNTEIKEVTIKIVNINNNTTIKGDQQAILHKLIPRICQRFGISDVCVTQESNAPCPVPNSVILDPPEEFGFISISLSTINKSCYIKFQTDKKKEHIFITLILNSYFFETKQLFVYLDNFEKCTC